MEEPVNAAAPDTAKHATESPHARKANARVPWRDATTLLSADDALEGLRHMVALAERTRPRARALMDASLMLVTTAGLLRPSETAALRRSDARISATGVHIRLASQRAVRFAWVERTGTGMCAVAALERWIEAAPGREGPLFRRIGPGGKASQDALGPSYVRRTFRRYAIGAGLDAALFAPMSLRAILVARAFRADPANFRRLAPHMGCLPVSHLLHYYRLTSPKRAKP